MGKKNKKTSCNHNYEEVLVYYMPLKRWCLGEQCSKCGKVKIEKIFITEKIGDKEYRLVSSEEIFERYKDNLKTVFKEEE